MEVASKGLSRGWLGAGAVAVLLGGGATWLWMERAPIAASYIDDALGAKGVPASYRLTRIGFRTQRIEGIRIGDPAHPDLVADWAEIELRVGLTGVGVRAIDAGGVRLRGRLIDGRLSLGAIDRLLPKGRSDQPFTLPDIGLTARSARLDVETPQGLVRATLDGRGNLKDGFRGSLMLGSDRLASGDCAAIGVAARLRLTVEDGRPHAVGPVGARRIACPQAAITAPVLAIDARGGSDLTRWRGAVGIRKGGLIARQGSADRLTGTLDFDLSGDRIQGQAQLGGAGLRHGRSSADRLLLAARWRAEARGRSATIDGEVRLGGGQFDPVAADNMARRLASVEGVPPGPILAAWSRAFRRASQHTDGVLAFALHHAPAAGGLRIERIDLKAAGGGRLLVRSEGAEGLGWRWPQGGLVVNASAQLSGGGLPQLSASLRQAVPGAPLSGSATIAPYQADGARLGVAPVLFEPGPGGGTLVSTRVVMDGPLADGRIEGLNLPIRLVLGRGGSFALNPGCTPFGFDRLAIAGTVIARASLPACAIQGALLRRDRSGPLKGGARIRMPRLRGKVGDQPLLLSARSLDIAVARPGFRLDALAVRLGDPASPTRLDVATLEGRVDARGLSGRFAGTAGKLAAVPLLISEGAGGWALEGGRLSLDGAIRVDDADTANPRFRQLISDDVRLSLLGGRIAATATLREPRSGAAVTRVAVRHDLSRGRGDALLDVDGLRFGQSLQPEAVTPLTLGMIANVYGTLKGQGRINWSDGKVASDGSFSTDGLNLAAAFGPVTGLKGTISFTDLLGLVTAPDQQVTVAEINPGVAVTNGVIRYRILADRKLSVAEGRWPFAGGTLVLEPTLLDMGQPVARRLTFRIDGLDAASFVQQLEFKNIAVTGRFDGVLPIIFDAHGGRIENGVLKVRPGGGTLSYVGDVTNADLGRVARIAFDALKSMRYDRLTIDLNGSLDGEIVSQVRFDGTNDQPAETARRGGLVGRLLAPVTRLPFRFKITITAPFRGLVNSAQTFVDPSIVLRNSAAGTAIPVPAPAPAPIQPR
jgi:hypothetical protein